MDVDIHGLRAFAVAAEELHFGRAAVRLHLSQQALSKRIRRLEDALGTRLFERTTRSVELTAAGRRFLPRAADAVAAFDRAVDSVRTGGEPLRVDVYDERFTPLRMLREASAAEPPLRVELSMRQGLSAALPALRRGEIDAAFGRVHDTPRPWPAELACRLVRLEPLDAFVPADHLLAGREALRPADLREHGIAMPDPAGAEEWRGYLTRLCERFGLPLRFTEPAIGQWHLVELFLREKAAVGLGERSIDAGGSGLRRVPIVEPEILMPWWIVWRRRDPPPPLRTLLRRLGRGPRLPAPADPLRWVPDTDRHPVDA
ncbi:LysR family transcriptional regulator [Nonomuraea roseoviolacea subsp. roseoviolacea]|uniref:LysR family transcriptional regulator n=1 Tax=Nonomuraea roseoviolacea TaxID=103837 RepID=UPI0031D36AEE